MGHVVTITNKQTQEIVSRRVFHYPKLAEAVAAACQDYTEAETLSEKYADLMVTPFEEKTRIHDCTHFDVTCQYDAYSQPEDNDLDPAAQLRVRLQRLIEDEQAAQKVR